MFRSLLKTTPAALVLSVVTASFAFGADPPATKVSASAKGTAGASDEVAVLETTKGKMVIEFWDKEAPKTVANFKKLARQGFYDGTGFHRIIKGFMVQGGDPKSKNPKATDLGTGDPGYKIDAEFNSKKHVPGVISMARGSDPNSAGSQFFLMHGAAPSLDGQYTAFGRIIEGMDVLNDIAATPVTMNPMMNEKSKPAEWTTLKSVKIVSRASLAKAKPAAGKSAAASLNAAENKKAAATKTAETSGAATATEKKASDTGTTETAPPASSSETSKPDSVQGQGSTGHEGHGH